MCQQGSIDSILVGQHVSIGSIHVGKQGSIGSIHVGQGFNVAFQWARGL